MSLKGSYLHKPSGKYLSEISINGKRVALGAHDTPELAHQAWLEMRASHPRISRKGRKFGSNGKARAGEQTRCRKTDASLQKMADEADALLLSRCQMPLVEREQLPTTPSHVLDILLEGARATKNTRMIAQSTEIQLPEKKPNRFRR